MDKQCICNNEEATITRNCHSCNVGWQDKMFSFERKGNCPKHGSKPIITCCGMPIYFCDKCYDQLDQEYLRSFGTRDVFRKKLSD